jgi:hypothetical protein
LLALYIKQVSGESLSASQAKITDKEVEDFSKKAISDLGEKKLSLGNAQKIASSGEIVLPIVTPVMIDNKNSASVVAIISLRDFARIMSETKQMSEAELWEAGFPIIFVVDRQGQAIFHPDSQITDNQKNLSDLKIVKEWKESHSQIQSALVPFTADYNAEEHQMIGAYSTANFTSDLKFGVIAMQDENKALASVADMRWQTWLISLALAFFALVVGSILAKQTIDLAFIRSRFSRAKSRFGRSFDPNRNKKYQGNRNFGQRL